MRHKQLQNMPMIVQRSKAVKGACGSKIIRGGHISRGLHFRRSRLRTVASLCILKQDFRIRRKMLFGAVHAGVKRRSSEHSRCAN